MLQSNTLRVQILIAANARKASDQLNKISQRFKKIQKDTKKAGQKFDRFGRTAKKALYGLDRALDNTKNNVSNTAIRISNKLGFLAFQWNFMANAATQSLRTVVQGFTGIINIGAKLDHERIRAIAYAASLDEISVAGVGLAKVAKDVTQKIYELGAGGSAFDIEEVAQQYTQLLKAVPDSDIATKMLEPLTKIKLLEPDVDSERLATGFVTLLNLSGVEGTQENITKMFDFTAALVDNTTLRFNDAIGSISRLMPLVKQFNWEMTDAGAMIALVADYLGRNKSSGKAASAAGTWSAAALAEIMNLTNPTTSAGKAAIELGLNIYENGQIVSLEEMAQRLRDFSDQFETQEQLTTAFNELQITGNGLAVLLQLTELGPEWVRNMKDTLRTVDALNARWKVLQGTSDTSMKRIKAGVDGLKASFVGGLSPALYAFAEGIHQLTSSETARATISTLSFEISKVLVPGLTMALKVIRGFLEYISDNRQIISHFAKVILVAVASMALFAGITTLAFLMLVFGSSTLAAAGQVGVMVTQLRLLTIHSIIMLGSIIALFAGIVMLAWGLGELIKYINPDKNGDALKAVLALAVGFGLLGLVGYAQIGNIKSFGGAIGRMATKLWAASVAATAFFASSVGKFPTFMNRPGAVNPAFPKFYQTAGKNSGNAFLMGLGAMMAKSPHIMIAAAAVIIAVGATIGPALSKQFERIKYQAEEMGLKSSWDIVKMDWELAWVRIVTNPLTIIDSFKRSLGDFQQYLGNWGKEIVNIGTSIGKILANITNPDIRAEEWLKIKNSLSVLKESWEYETGGEKQKDFMIGQIQQYIDAQGSTQRGLSALRSGSEGTFSKTVRDRIDIAEQDGMFDQSFVEEMFKEALRNATYLTVGDSRFNHPNYANNNGSGIDGLPTDINIGSSNNSYEKLKSELEAKYAKDISNIKVQLDINDNTSNGVIIEAETDEDIVMATGQ